MIKRKADLVCVLIFCVLICVFFYKSLFAGQVPAPIDALVGLYSPWRDYHSQSYPRGLPFRNFLITDPIRQQIPWRKIAIDQWKKGDVPLWNPYNFSGTSLIGNIQAAVFYPFNIFFLFLDFPIAWTLIVVLQPVLAAIFLYVYLRSNRLSPSASLFGGFLWGFSGFMIAWLTWGTIGHVVLWLPLILLAVDKLNTKRLAWSSILIFALSSSLLAGHAQLSLYVIILSGFYALWKRGGFFWICLFVSLLLTSIQWIPFAQTLLESSRVASADSWQVLGWFLPWQHLAQFVAPDFFGNPATLNYWGVWNYGEFIGYLGVGGIVFALFSLLMPNKTAGVKFWTTTLIVSILFMLPTPLAKLPYILNIPIVSSLQPTRLMAIVDFALVLLAAFGFEQWKETKDKRIWYSLGIIGLILLILLAVANSLGVNALVARRNVILPFVLFGATALAIILKSLLSKKIRVDFVFALLLVITVFDLIRFGWKFTPFVDQKYFFPKTKAIEFLESQPKPFRILSLDKAILPPNTASFYGIESVDGYDPIFSLRFEEFMAASERGRPDIHSPFGFNRIISVQNISSPLLSLLNVGYVLSFDEISNPLYPKVFEEGRVKIYKYNNGVPRVFPVSKLIRTNSKQDAVDKLFDPTFNPKNVALVEEDIDVSPVPLMPSENIKIKKYIDQTLEFTTNFQNSHFVVISTSYFPNWHVTIDGIESKIYRADYILQGVVVPSGDHSIKLWYK